jgi:hypothetical protein
MAGAGTGAIAGAGAGVWADAARAVKIIPRATMTEHAPIIER